MLKYTIYGDKKNNENLGHKEIVPMKTVCLTHQYDVELLDGLPTAEEK